MGLLSWAKDKASGALHAAEDFGSSALHTAESVGSAVVDDAGSVVHATEDGIVDTAKDAYSGISKAATVGGEVMEGGVESMLGPVAGNLMRGVIHGDEAVSDQKQAQGSLADIAQKTGLSDIYEGATDLPGVGDYVKMLGSAYPKMSLGSSKLGAWIHDEL
jgi:hypothetical protein